MEQASFKANNTLDMVIDYSDAISTDMRSEH